MPFEIREPSGGDREALASIVAGCDNLTAEEKDCALELFDIYLEERRGAEGAGGEGPAQGAGVPEYQFHCAFGADGRQLGFVCYGTAALCEGVYEIYWIAADRSARRTGVATALFGHAERFAAGEGARMLVVETSGLPAYRAARDLYAACGFTEEARVRGYYRPGDDKVIYVKKL